MYVATDGTLSSWCHSLAKRLNQRFPNCVRRKLGVWTKFGRDSLMRKSAVVDMRPSMKEPSMLWDNKGALWVDSKLYA